MVSSRTPTAVEPSGFVTRTSQSRFFFGPPGRISTLAVSCVELSQVTLSTRGVNPLPFAKVTLAPSAKPVPVITKAATPAFWLTTFGLMPVTLTFTIGGGLTVIVTVATLLSALPSLALYVKLQMNHSEANSFALRTARRRAIRPIEDSEVELLEKNSTRTVCG